jgi:hypothetical protein
MSDEKKTAPGVQASFGNIQMGSALVGLSPIPLPIIYFDSSPSLSHMNGVIGVTLVASGNVPSDGTVINVASVVAHLKCNIAAAEGLIATLQSAILLARPAEQSETGKAN